MWFGAGTGTHWKRLEICVSERESDLQSVRLGRSDIKCRKAIGACYISASVGNELSHHGLPIQRFHTSRLA